MAKATKAMIALAVSIAASETGFLMLTQAEGKALVDAGFAVVDPSNVEGDKAAVSLTETGVALVPAEGGAAVATGFEIDDGVPVPTGTNRRGRESGYPFDKLEVNQSFHVAPKAGETPADTAARLQSSVSSARASYAEGTGEFETKSVKVYAKDANGSFIKDAEGKRVVAETKSEQREKMKLTRDFMVRAVDATDPKGAGARVWRTA